MYINDSVVEKYRSLYRMLEAYAYLNNDNDRLNRFAYKILQQYYMKYELLKLS